MACNHYCDCTKGDGGRYSQLENVPKTRSKLRRLAGGLRWMAYPIGKLIWLAITGDWG